MPSQVDVETADISTGDHRHLGIRCLTDHNPPACGPLPTVLGNPTPIRQVHDNLTGNAIEYTPAGRVAEITIRATAPDPATCRIEMASRGIGIPKTSEPKYSTPPPEPTAANTTPEPAWPSASERHNGTVRVDADPGGRQPHFWPTLATPAVQSTFTGGRFAALEPSALGFSYRRGVEQLGSSLGS
ncbi:hypothetical protein Q0Z83_096720 [Actinoplanes sichuanensis]|uniref:ATP-binding protein n=1 Tax=Actinoplanes sichuanensis TaxID=512349 RepID=A0ABW4ART3_9ACTN|nr:hypothetical protein Q0Z83_096720 [Actinoplanes sichuanensis]